MHFGFFGINIGPCAQGTAAARVARAAEASGFESVWTGEHVVLPDPQASPSPLPPQTPMLDPAVALTVAATSTTRLRLGTGIIILPQRNPVVLAKQIASLDVLSGGRFVLGVGVGYLEPEFRAIGADFENRGAVTDEFVEAMQHLWYDEHPEYHGRYAAFSGVDAYPRPVQQPIPIVVGGHTGRAYRRAVACAHGWYGFAMTPDDVARCVDGLRVAADAVARPDALGPLEITVTPRGRLTPEVVAAFVDAGVDRLVPFPSPTPDGVTKTIETALEAVSGF
jgi:probable F420-dependent oxidoreductase